MDAATRAKRGDQEYRRVQPLRRSGRWALALVASLGLTAAAPAEAVDQYTSRHSDLAVGYDSTQDTWDFSLLCQGCAINGVPIVGEQAFEPGEIEIVVPELTETAALGAVLGLVDDTATGAGPGSTYFKLPESEIEADGEGAPFLGWLRAGVELGDFVGNQITVELVDVSYTGDSGSAEFSMFSSDPGLGIPRPHFWFSSFDEPSSVNGVYSIDLSVGPGSHSHFNLGFTEKGSYHVTVRTSGQLVGGGGASPGEATYTFVVAPESGPTPAPMPVPVSFPALAVLAAALLGAGAWLARRGGGPAAAGHGSVAICPPAPALPQGSPLSRPVSRDRAGS